MWDVVDVGRVLERRVGHALELDGEENLVDAPGCIARADPCVVGTMLALAYVRAFVRAREVLKALMCMCETR